MKVLILGDGLLSTELKKITSWPSISRNINNIDALNFSNWSNLLKDFDVIVNCIANTDTYSNDKDLHWNINYKFVSELVDYCNINNKKLVHISTDYVYANSVEFASENDVPVHNRDWYSYTKLLADAYIELKSNNYLICRCDHKEYPFKYIHVWANQIGNFDYVNNIARGIKSLIIGKTRGLYNVGTECKRLYDLASLTKNDLIEIPIPNYAPSNVSMNVNKFNSFLNKTKKVKEVVISAYERDYDWINELNDDIQITVYRKGKEKLKINEIKIEPNLGRDVHTFFYHLYHNYDNLADITFFSQDYYIDHIPNYIDIINSNQSDLNKYAIQRIDNSCWFFHNTNVSYLIPFECNSKGQPICDNLNLDDIWNKLFSIIPPSKYYFTPAGHFAITREHARKIDRNVYKKILNILENFELSPWEIERLEAYIFIYNYKDLYV
jgi:dTDP-4-dehydrorhamnose reductase